MNISLRVVAQKIRNALPIMACLNPKLEEIRLGNGESRDRLGKILRKTILQHSFLLSVSRFQGKHERSFTVSWGKYIPFVMLRLTCDAARDSKHTHYSRDSNKKYKFIFKSTSSFALPSLLLKVPTMPRAQFSTPCFSV